MVVTDRKYIAADFRLLSEIEEVVREIKTSAVPIDIKVDGLRDHLYIVNETVDDDVSLRFYITQNDNIWYDTYLTYEDLAHDTNGAIVTMLLSLVTRIGICETQRTEEND